MFGDLDDESELSKNSSVDVRFKVLDNLENNETEDSF